MSDKFSIDDILAEFSEQNKQSKSNIEEKKSKSNAAPKNNEPSATMILNSIDEKKKTDKEPEDTREVTAQSIREAMQKQKEAIAKAKAAQKPEDKAKAAQKPDAKAKSEQNQEQKKPAEKASLSVNNANSDSRYKRLSEFEEEKPKSVKKQSNNKNTEKKPAEKPVALKKTADRASENKTQDKKPANSEKHELVFKKHTKPAKEKASVSINTSANLSFADKVKRNRFLFEELTKRDFKKKYKRTMVGILWSVVSPFLTFLIQYFVFGYIFDRLDTGFIVYLLTGTLMFSFFSNATTAGMFSMYSNGSILSKVKVPKALFVLSSNSAATFNFFLTLIVYFGFMLVCKVNFGPHLLLMIYPILCLIVFNIGMSYVLSALFVFFRDVQYLYQIFTMLLSYLSAIFYEIKAFPEHFQMLFYINPIYEYISYMRELVMQSSIPSFQHHVVCLAFSLGMLGIGLLIHKKTEQKFVYYY